MARPTTLTPDADAACQHMRNTLAMNDAICSARDAGAASQSLASAQVNDVSAQAIVTVAGISNDVQIG